VPLDFDRCAHRQSLAPADGDLRPTIAGIEAQSATMVYHPSALVKPICSSTGETSRPITLPTRFARVIGIPPG
jgi:hypothetical protein